MEIAPKRRAPRGRSPLQEIGNIEDDSNLLTFRGPFAPELTLPLTSTVINTNKTLRRSSRLGTRPPKRHCSVSPLHSGPWADGTNTLASEKTVIYGSERSPPSLFDGTTVIFHEEDPAASPPLGRRSTSARVSTPRRQQEETDFLNETLFPAEGGAAPGRRRPTRRSAVIATQRNRELFGRDGVLASGGRKRRKSASKGEVVF